VLRTIDSCRLPQMHRINIGFTLLEMLVVLVILGMTTTLLSQGLATTWQNFERLGTKHLSLSAAELPRQWFRDSVKHALLYHPYQAVVQGGPASFRLVSAAVPNDPDHVPKFMEWTIKEEGGIWSLGFFAQDIDPVFIKDSIQPMQFQYLVQDEWGALFSPEDARLPNAVRVIEGVDTWIMVVPGRPVEADVPPELALFGEYDF